MPPNKIVLAAFIFYANQQTLNCRHSPVHYYCRLCRRTTNGQVKRCEHAALWPQPSQ